MKKNLIYLVLILILMSCQKESLLSMNNDLQLTNKSINTSSQLVKKSRNYTVIFETSDAWEYGRTLYNECYPENVRFSGLIPYHVQYLQYGTASYISYDIDFGNFSGTGETSGLKYSINRNRYTGIIPDSPETDGYNIILGRRTVQMTYKTSAGNALIITENIIFALTKSANMYATFNEIAVGCK